MHPRPLLLLTITAALGGALLASPVQAKDDPATADHHGRGLLTRPVAGAHALKALGGRLDEAAAVNRMSSANLKHLLATDPSSALSREGHLFYADQITAPDLLAPVAAAQGLVEQTLYPSDQTFALHSNPGSLRTIYLDFNGYTLPPGNAWATEAGVPALTFAGTSPDDAYIQAVWRMVAEKFAPFDVDVTTQDPGPDALNRTTGTDTRYGTRVVFTDDPRARPSTCTLNGCVGVAWLDVFDGANAADKYEPAWVFTTLQFSGAPPSRVGSATAAEAAAHEVGHTLGLHHDGSDSTSYFDGLGHGNWFPLMGSGYNAVGQWSKGEYFGANNTEDDTALIATNGAPLRTDDAGDTVATALPLGAYSSYVRDGVISTPTDVDVYSVQRSCNGPLVATASGIGVGQSVDLAVTISSPDTDLLTVNPPSSQTGPYTQLPLGMDASAALPLVGPGIYTVKVAGSGRGSALFDGYSRYGSLGGYRLSISGCPGDPAPAPAPAWPVVSAPYSPPLFLTPPAPPAIVPALSVPSAPGIARATSGTGGKPVTATARWSAPVRTGGAAVIGYRVRAVRLSAAGRVLRTTVSPLIAARSRSFTMRLPAGRYRFMVVALNQVGASPASRASATVLAR